MWGSDYPHDEGTGPFTTEHLRQVFHDADPDELVRVLGGNAAKLYDFDLDALAPLAEQYGPTVEEIAAAAHRAAGEPQHGAASRPGSAARLSARVGRANGVK